MEVKINLNLEDIQKIKSQSMMNRSVEVYRSHIGSFLGGKCFIEVHFDHTYLKNTTEEKQTGFCVHGIEYRWPCDECEKVLKKEGYNL